MHIYTCCTNKDVRQCHLCMDEMMETDDETCTVQSVMLCYMNGMFCVIGGTGCGIPVATVGRIVAVLTDCVEGNSSCTARSASGNSA